MDVDATTANNEAANSASAFREGPSANLDFLDPAGQP